MEEVRIQEIIEKLMKEVIEEALSRKNGDKKRIIPVEVSARHAHLSKEDVEVLFGKGYKLTPKRELSQPGEFLSNERITVIGPKGVIKNVAVLGPERNHTQVELSRTDAISIGIDPPLRLSGDIKESAPILISSGKKIIQKEEGAIVAQKHIHMTPEDAERFGLKDKDIVSVRILSDRPIIFEDVLVRVSENFSLNMHIDFDEANACDFKPGTMGEILTEEGS
ncbi:MAG: phosphate propanoyltransferase [Clostridiales bacterium]|nr:phosphate propanoyltransferase [Clostridiales bacterium]